MGRLSEYRSKNILPPQDTTAQQRVQVEARGQQAIGEAIGNIGQQVYQAGMMETRIRNRNYINETSTQMERHFNEYQQEMLKTMRQDPDIDNPGRREVYQGFLDKEYKKFMGEALKKAPNGRAAEVFSQGAENAYNSMIQAHNRNFEATFIENSNLKVQERAKESALKAYRNPGPKTLDVVKAEIEAASRVFDDTMDPRMAKEARDKLFQQATTAMFEGWLDKNMVNTADKALKSRQYDDELGAERVSGIQKRINMMKKARAKKKKDLTMMKLFNPWKYLNELGKMPKQPLAFGEIKNNKQYIDRMAFLEANPDMQLSFFTPIDQAVIEKRVAKAPVNHQIAVLEHWAKQPDAIYGRIGQSIPRQMRTALGLVRNGDSKSLKLAEEIIEGMKLVTPMPGEKKPEINLPKKEDLNSYISESLAGMITNPDAISDITQAATAVAVTRAIKKGGDPSAINYDDVEDVVKETLGDPIKINSSRIFPIRKEDGTFYSDSEMESMHESLSSEILKKTHGSLPLDANKVVIKPEEDRDYFYYKPVGADRYQLYFEENDVYYPLYKNLKENQPYIIDFKKLLPYYSPDKGWGEWVLEAAGIKTVEPKPLKQRKKDKK